MKRSKMWWLLLTLLAAAVVIVASSADTLFPEDSGQDPSENFETVVLEPEKPESLGAVPMKTYRSPAGYEITHPVAWDARTEKPPEESPDIRDRYFIEPPGGSLEFPPFISIRVLPRSSSSFEPDPTIGEKWVILPAERGILFQEQTDLYYFQNTDGGKTFLVQVGSRAASDTLKDELNWVVSTFRVTE